MALDLNKVKEEAKKEFEEEHMAKAKKLIKKKMRELCQAEQIVANLKMELQDLEMSIQDGTAFAKDGC